MSLFPDTTAALATLVGDMQCDRLLRLHFPHGDGPAHIQFLANSLDASESLSRDFSCVVEVLSDDAAIALDKVMGKMVAIALVREDGTLRYFNGYMFELRYRDEQRGQFAELIDARGGSKHFRYNSQGCANADSTTMRRATSIPSSKRAPPQPARWAICATRMTRSGNCCPPFSQAWPSISPSTRQAICSTPFPPTATSCNDMAISTIPTMG